MGMRAVSTSNIVRRLGAVLILLALPALAWLAIRVAALPTASAAPLPEALIWPLSGSAEPDSARISSPFGPRWQASQSRYDYHSGLDLAAPQGTPVHAVADATVYRVGWLSADSGLAIILYHPALGYYSAYLHLDSALVAEGDSIVQGQIIGTTGNSGTTEFYHLHFEIRLSAGNYPTCTRNPMAYLLHPELGAPTIRVTSWSADPIYSPTVQLLITTTRAELDLNQVRVTLLDLASGSTVDDQWVDFNERVHTGGDSLDQDGIRLIPSHFNTATVEYELAANFYRLHGFDSMTVTVQAVDLAGNAATDSAVILDTTPPGRVTTLNARWRLDGGIDLAWVAPGDSGPIGQAAAYEFRYAQVPINSFTWSSAVILPNPPVPLAGGQSESWSVTLPVTAPVYLAMRTSDDEGNRSLISNSAPALWPRCFLPVVFKGFVNPILP